MESLDAIKCHDSSIEMSNVKHTGIKFDCE